MSRPGEDLDGKGRTVRLFVPDDAPDHAVPVMPADAEALTDRRAEELLPFVLPAGDGTVGLFVPDAEELDPR